MIIMYYVLNLLHGASKASPGLHTALKFVIVNGHWLHKQNLCQLCIILHRCVHTILVEFDYMYVGLVSLSQFLIVSLVQGTKQLQSGSIQYYI